jgi:hypothetical protein
LKDDSATHLQRLSPSLTKAFLLYDGRTLRGLQPGADHRGSAARPRRWRQGVFSLAHGTKNSRSRGVETSVAGIVLDNE